MAQTKKLKEELTTEMHSEFSVTIEDDIKHRVWAVMKLCEVDKKDPQSFFDLFII